jgi:hypothetical protein
MRISVVLATLLSLCGAANADVPDDFGYEILDGAIVVFGHSLVPAEPLPVVEKCDDCGPFHSVNFVPSPDKRWVLITSDVHLANFDAWIFDTRSKNKPLRVADKRRGRHFAGAEWHSNQRLELTFGGMGYSVSLLFDAVSSVDAKIIGDLLLYDAERDVYVRYVRNFEVGTDQVEVGQAFTVDGAIDRFTIALDNEFLSKSRFMIESVEIDAANLFVTYETTAKGKVREVFKPQALDRM